MENVLDKSFINQYENTSENLYEELKSRADSVILNSIKGYLREKKIEFDGSSIDLEYFRNNVVDKLEEPIKTEIFNLENRLKIEMDTMINDLRAGSQTAFGKFAEGLAGVGKSALEMVARCTAVKAAYLMNPTVGGIVLGTSIMAPAAYKAVKNIKLKSEEHTKTALDVMLFKLAISKEGEEQKIDISKTTMDTVYENLQSEGITVNKEDATLFLRDVANLDNSQKEKVVNTMNNIKGNVFDVKDEIKKTKLSLKNIRETLGKDVVVPISTAALYGMTVGGVLNDVAPDAIAPIITALGIGGATGNVLGAAGAGGLQFGLSKILKEVPILGQAIETANNAETMLAASGVAITGVVLARVLPGLVYKGAKGLHDKLKNKKQTMKDNELLDEAVADKLKIASEEVDEEISARSDKDVMLDVVRDVLSAKGINLPTHINSSEELKVYLKGLNNEDKKYVQKIATILGNIKEDSDKSFKKIMGKVAKTAYWGGVLALAGLGMYDAFIEPGFLEGLSKQDEMAEQLEELTAARASEEEIARAQEAKILEYQNEIKARAEEMTNEVREFLPENIDGTNIMKEPGIWKAKNCVPNRVIVPGINIDTEEGLISFFEGINPKDERLIQLMEKADVQTIEELAKSDYMKDIINTIGNHTYFPEITFTEGGALDYYKFAFFDKGKMQNDMIGLINDTFKENLSDIPLKTASTEEISEFIDTVMDNPKKLEYLATYMGATEKANGNYIVENIKHLSDTWMDALSEDMNAISESEQNILAAQEKLKAAQESIADYQAEIAKQEGLIKGIQSDVPSNPYEVFGKGAAVGAAVGAISETAKGKKGLFSGISKIVSDIKNKFGKRKRQLALSSGDDEKQTERESKENPIDKYQFKLEPVEIKNESNSKKSIQTGETQR